MYARVYMSHKGATLGPRTGYVHAREAGMDSDQLHIEMNSNSTIYLPHFSLNSNANAK